MAQWLRTSATLPEDLRLLSSTHVSSQPPCNSLILVDLMPSSGLQGHQQACTWCPYIHAGTCTNISFHKMKVSQSFKREGEKDPAWSVWSTAVSPLSGPQPKGHYISSESHWQHFLVSSAKPATNVDFENNLSFKMHWPRTQSNFTKF